MADIEKGWVLFGLNKQQYGLPIKNLLQMVVLENVVKQRTAPEYVRGVITLRGSVIPVIDLRMRLGIPSMDLEILELTQLLEARKQDHINWLNALSASVEQKQEFALTTDPHKCAFGKWYDHFKTDNPILSMHLEKFDTPHRRIHAIAVQVKQLEKENRHGEAHALIEKTRKTDLAAMIKLFDSAVCILKESQKEIVLVMKIDNQQIGFIVDDVKTVRDIPTEKIQCPEEIADQSATTRNAAVAEVDGLTSILLTPNDVACSVSA